MTHVVGGVPNMIRVHMVSGNTSDIIRYIANIGKSEDGGRKVCNLYNRSTDVLIVQQFVICLCILFFT